MVANARSRDVLLPAAISGSVVASPPPQPVCQVVYARRAIARREVAGLLDPAAVHARLVGGEQRGERPLVNQRGRPGQLLAQRVQPFEQRGNVGAVEHVDARPELSPRAAGADGRRRRATCGRRSPAIAERDRRAAAAAVAGEHDDAEARGGYMNAERGRRQVGRSALERRWSRRRR